MENDMMVSQIIKNKVIIWPTEAAPGYILKRIGSRDLNRHLYTHVHMKSSFELMFKRGKQPINTLMDKQNMVYTYNGPLFSFKKKGNSDTCYNIDEAWGHNAKGNNPVTKEQILDDSIHMRYTERSDSGTESRRVLYAWGGEWELVFSGDGVSVLRDEKRFGDGWR